MKTSSAKAKGRRLQNLLRDELLKRFPVDPADVKCAVMGEAGDDLRLSPAALAYFPFSVECKNTERLNLWQAIRQVAERARNIPLVVFARNRQIPWAALSLDALLNVMQHRAHLVRENARLQRALDECAVGARRRAVHEDAKYTPASPLD